MARLTASVTQGGNDAFAISEVQTALQGQTRNAYRISQIEYQIVLPANSVFPAQNAAHQRLQFGLTRRTKAAMPNITDVDVLKIFDFMGSYLSASGYLSQGEASGIWVPPSDMIVVEDPIYAVIDSNGTAATWGIVFAIDYEVVTISEVDRLTLLTQSLQ